MTHSSIGRLALGAVLAVSLGAWDCGGGSSDTTPDGGTSHGADGATCQSAPDAPPATGSYSHFVMNSVKVGTTTNDAIANGFDLDGDGRVDNSLGKTLAGLHAELDIDASLADALNAGEFVILHSLRGDTTSAAAASWQVYLGKSFTPPATPDFSGNGQFMISPMDSGNAVVHGAVSGGKFTTTTPATITVELSFQQGSQPITVTLHDARVEATISGNTCTGKLGGAILASDLSSSVIPQLADVLNARLAADVENGCTMSCQASKQMSCCSSTNRTILTLFDSNGDYMLTADELKANEVIQAILSPDVDLLDSSGKPCPDGTPESVSIGLGFTCVKANFTAPNEQ